MKGGFQRLFVQGLVVGNLFVSDVLESSMLLMGKTGAGNGPKSFGAASGCCNACRLKQESIAMLPRMRFVRAGWWPLGHE